MPSAHPPAHGTASASIYACFGTKEDLFRKVMALYGTTSGEPPRRALREQPTARAAIHAMLRATADEITRPATTDGEFTAPPVSVDALARYYTTVVQGLPLQARRCHPRRVSPGAGSHRFAPVLSAGHLSNGTSMTTWVAP